MSDPCDDNSSEMLVNIFMIFSSCSITRSLVIGVAWVGVVWVDASTVFVLTEIVITF